MTIQFNEISQVKIPLVYVEFDSSRASEGLTGVQPYKVLLIGESNNESKNKLVQIFNPETAKKEFGSGTLFEMAEVYFKNSDVPLWGIDFKKAISDKPSSDKPSLASVVPGATPSTPDKAKPSIDLDSIFSTIKDHHFNLIACSFSDEDTLKLLASKLKERSSAKRQLDCFAVVGVPGISQESMNLKINSAYVAIMPICHSASSTHVWSAALAGAIASSAQLDPARPFHTLPLLGIQAPKLEEIDDRIDREKALSQGISTFCIDAGGGVRIERLVTTYTQNDAGAVDVSLSSPNVPLVLSFIRWDLKRYFMLKYPRHKLATDNYRGSGAVMTPRLARAECICLFKKWEQAGLVQDIDLFQEGLITEINKTDPSRLDISMSPKLVNQLCILGAKVSFLL